MTWASALLGATLCTKGPDGSSVTKSTEEVLANKKFVALYFSAHVRGYSLLLHGASAQLLCTLSR